MCQRPNAAVYVEEERLETVHDGIKLGAAELRPFEFISWSSSGLIVCGYQFSDRQPTDLAALLARAIAELKVASH